eukprot:2984_1
MPYDWTTAIISTANNYTDYVDNETKHLFHGYFHQIKRSFTKEKSLFINIPNDIVLVSILFYYVFENLKLIVPMIWPICGDSSLTNHDYYIIHSDSDGYTIEPQKKRAPALYGQFLIPIKKPVTLWWHFQVLKRAPSMSIGITNSIDSWPSDYGSFGSNQNSENYSLSVCTGYTYRQGATHLSSDIRARRRPAIISMKLNVGKKKLSFYENHGSKKSVKTSFYDVNLYPETRLAVQIRSLSDNVPIGKMKFVCFQIL